MDPLSGFVEDVGGQLQGRLSRDVPLCDHTTYRVGGPARVFVDAGSEADVLTVLRRCAKLELPLALLGNGSNVVAPDAGIAGVVLKLGARFARIERDGEGRVIAEAGAMLEALSNAALGWQRTGFEWMIDIPGSVGGAVLMNAGNDGGEVKKIVEQVRFVDRAGQVQQLSGDDLGLGYRQSRFKQSGEIVLGATFVLGPADDPEAIEARMEQSRTTRWRKFPMEFANAGSVFKRPPDSYAGKLIQDAGLKGFTVGQAQVSEKHAGFIVNLGGATAADILGLTQQVQEIVQQRFGVALEAEQLVLEAKVPELSSPDRSSPDR